MKVKLTLLILCLTYLSYAQNGINYKALIKDDNGNAIVNQSISIQLSIQENADTIYQETHVETTSNNGFIVLNIGEGTSSLGNFSNIDWSSNPHFLKVEIDTGNGLVDMGTSQFKTVPYALSSADSSWEKSGNDIYRDSGNIAVGSSSAEQKLDVNGKIKIADDNTAPTEGTMRYNSVTKNFEGYDGTKWVILNNNPSFNVTTITAPDNDTPNYTDFTFISGSRISFSIDFSAPMNISSAVIGSSILIGDDGTGTGTMNWSNGDTRLTITTDQSYFDLSADCFSGVPIILKGNGINQLLDANNLAIDGDDDGIAGGDFVVIFVTIC
ncbi:hypothetical protein [uncultured Psychroserpens sp.]|uniref:hypothetical protein n=1 Tax=uncultured Psychroserpens sp. TaxID=255436 RepID=UPI00261E7D92|nr:hypothetical protein [uncultured Psychroserpens sp.]